MSSNSQTTQQLQDSLGLACQAQFVPRILQGRNEILAMPKAWVLSVINQTIHESLNINDPWEYRRLLELLSMLDMDLLSKYIELGLNAQNPEIFEAASDFQNQPNPPFNSDPAATGT